MALVGMGGGAAKVQIGYVTERDFEAKVLRSELPVMVQFTAQWCGPCKQIAPEVESAAAELSGRATFVRVDIDKAPALARQLRVQSVPTFMVFAKGRVADGVSGAIRKKAIKQMIEPFLPRARGAMKPLELAELLTAGAVVPVDTRDRASFDRARLPSAVHIPGDEVVAKADDLFSLDGRPVLYCRSGDVAKELASTLAQSGNPVAFLEGGLLAWELDGQPLERP